MKDSKMIKNNAFFSLLIEKKVVLLHPHLRKKEVFKITMQTVW
jgi:hypothetical protein